LLLVIYIYIINLTSYWFCKNFYFNLFILLFTWLLTFILSFSLRVQTVRSKIVYSKRRSVTESTLPIVLQDQAIHLLQETTFVSYTYIIIITSCSSCKVCIATRAKRAQRCLFIPSHRVLLTPVLSPPRRIGLVGNAIRVCYTLRFALLRFACYRIVYTYTMHVHMPLLRNRIVSHQLHIYILHNISIVRTYHDRKGKSFFHDPKSDRGLGHFKVVSVGGLRF